MALARTSTGGIQYHVSDAANNHVILTGVPSQTGSGPQTLRVVQGGNTIVFSQQNITDLLAALTAFSSTGVLS